MSAQPTPDLVDTLLSVIPSLPRTVLDRLVTDMIDRMDEMDGDLDLKDDEREPEWHVQQSPMLQLPGMRNRCWGRAGRLRCGQVRTRRRHRPLSHHWRKRGRH